MIAERAADDSATTDVGAGHISELVDATGHQQPAETPAHAAASTHGPTLRAIRDNRRMSNPAHLFVQQSVALLTDSFLPKIARSLETLSDEEVWWRPNDASNSIGNLLLHLRGNVTQWILGGVGGRSFERHRQGEFDARGGVPASTLLRDLSVTVQEAVEVIRQQTDASLVERRAIQGDDVTVLDAIYHVVEHFSMHTGQIILLAKTLRATDLRLSPRRP